MCKKKKRKKEGEGVVSIRGSLCPCNGVEFWFYLIGGSHPLFRDAGAIRHVSLNNSGRSFANSEAAAAAAVVLLLLFHTFLVTSSHSSCPPAPRRLLLDTLQNPRFSSPRAGSGRGRIGAATCEALRGAKRKKSE